MAAAAAFPDEAIGSREEGAGLPPEEKRNPSDGGS